MEVVYNNFDEFWNDNFPVGGGDVTGRDEYDAASDFAVQG